MTHQMVQFIGRPDIKEPYQLKSILLKQFLNNFATQVVVLVVRISL